MCVVYVEINKKLTQFILFKITRAAPVVAVVDLLKIQMKQFGFNSEKNRALFAFV